MTVLCDNWGEEGFGNREESSIRKQQGGILREDFWLERSIWARHSDGDIGEKTGGGWEIQYKIQATEG